MGIRRKVARFRGLGAGRRRRFLVAWLSLGVCSLSLSLFGSRRGQALLHRLVPRRPPRAFGKAECAAEWAGAVHHASQYAPWRALCLERSLTLWWLLARRGIAADLRIGVRKAGGELEAHAWVEHGGRVINDAEDVHQRFAAFDGAILPRDRFS